jgi:BolA protein
MNEERIERIRNLLETELTPDLLEIVDESHLHAGHAGAKSGMGHFRVKIIAKRFQGTSPLERHRIVYDALGDMMLTDIHALSITALAPESA